MTYRFTYRRRFFGSTVTVDGHRYDDKLDKMVLYLPGGGVREIPRWKDCHLALGADWVLAVKKQMERQAGASIPVG